MFGPVFLGFYCDDSGNEPGSYAVIVNYAKFHSGAVFSCISLVAAVFGVRGYFGDEQHSIGEQFTAIYGSFVAYAAIGVHTGSSV